MSGVVKIHITETKETLKSLLVQANTPQAKERVQALYWLKTKTVETVAEIAILLGRHRTTVQRWLQQYRQGGLQKLLEEKKSPGRGQLMPPVIVERLQTELNQPEGFQSYKEIQKWLWTCHNLKVSYRTVHQWVRYRLGAKLKVPRPVSIKQAQGAVEEFKKNSPN